MCGRDPWLTGKLSLIRHKHRALTWEALWFHVGALKVAATPADGFSTSSHLQINIFLQVYKLYVYVSISD